jgi:hypothetical protein
MSHWLARTRTGDSSRKPVGSFERERNAFLLAAYIVILVWSLAWWGLHRALAHFAPWGQLIVLVLCFVLLGVVGLRD